ncbi:MAG: Slp family lipoprotein [Desulfatiglandaceae bacterium]
MRTSNALPILITLMLQLSACSIISKEIRDEAEPPVAFKTLLEHVDTYIGKTVILGGYILEVQNRPGRTLISVLQTPLTFQDYPTSSARSEGNFLVAHEDFLDPRVFKTDSKITLAGRVIGLADEQLETCPNPCLFLESREIYIKREIEYDPNHTTDAYDFDDWTSSWERPY